VTVRSLFSPRSRARGFGINPRSRARDCISLVIVVAALIAGCGRHDYAERSALHLPVYPEAIVVDVPAAVQDKRGGHVIEVFTTMESFDKVRDWYAAMLPRSAQSVFNEARGQATYALFDDRRRSVHLESGGGRVYIYLSGDAVATTGR
jgi:hypothetical protein